MAFTSESHHIESPLLQDNRPPYKSNSGGWTSASFLIGVEVAERFAYYGIESNLIMYLTGPLHQSTATAAENVNAWTGTAFLLTLLGGFVADSFLGRFRTILIASVIYISGLGLLTVSAILPSTNDCPSSSEVFLFFFSLYLVAVGQGGHKPSAQAFGAEQFDGQELEQRKAKSSFFNWLYFGSCTGVLVTYLVLVYIQDNLNWALGFGIPCLTMFFGLFIFLLGAKTYRYSTNVQDKRIFRRIGRVFAATIRNWRTSPTEEQDCGSDHFKFLNRALLAPKPCSFSEVEEAKAVLRLVPIWIASLLYAVVLAQSSTFFTKQGKTMDRSISKGFSIPPASLQSFCTIASVIFIPIYDRLIVPFARVFTGTPSGISMLQRIGIGMALSSLSLVISAAVEKRRLDIARECGLVDMPNVTVPMSVWWLVPQYVLFGVSDVLTIVGLQEFFYDQVPKEVRSVGLSLYLSVFGVGSYISTFLVSGIEKATGREGHDSWFATNLNRGHLDYFYWLLAALSTMQLLAYLYYAKNYVYYQQHLSS